MNGARVLIGGTAADIATDTDPNTAVPPEDRCFFSAPPGSIGAGLDSVWAVAIDGTSLAVRLWMFDKTTKKWLALGAPVTVTTATGMAILSAQVPLFAKLFAQVTTNTGNVKSAVVGTGYGS